MGIIIVALIHISLIILRLNTFLYIFWLYFLFHDMVVHVSYLISHCIICAFLLISRSSLYMLDTNPLLVVFHEFFPFSLRWLLRNVLNYNAVKIIHLIFYSDHF